MFLSDWEAKQYSETKKDEFSKHTQNKAER